MKQYVLHNEEGIIQSLVTVEGPDGFGMMPVTRPGVYFIKIQPVKFAAKRPTLEEFSEFARTYKIETSNHPAMVIKR